MNRSSRTGRALFSAFTISSLFLAPFSFAENWPQWRGPRGDGTSEEKNLPTQWSRTDGIVWKSEIPGKGESTPIVWGDRVFLTCQVGDSPIAVGPTAGELKEQDKGKYHPKLLTLCYSASDGKLLWQREAPDGELNPTHDKHNQSSPSCVTDGELVYSWFATGPVLCHDFNGNKIWERDLVTDYGTFFIQFGHGSSPVLYEDLLILLCDHQKIAYLLAVDKKTGKTIWKHDREGPQRSYATPLIRRVGDHDEMFINTANRIDSFDPKTGKFLWKAAGLQIVMVPSPVFSNGIIYTSGGWNNGPVMAVKPGGEGDVTDSNVLWRKKNGGAYTPSLVFANDLLFIVNDGGVANCYDPKTGDSVWQERIGGTFSASPVAADGKIYVTSELGETVVLNASPSFNLVSRNVLDEDTLASPAISNGRIYIRTAQNLWCIGPKGNSQAGQ